MSEDIKIKTSGIGTFGLLGVVFVTLKLIGVITWSWWWVTAPFWAGFAIVLGILVSVLVLVAIGFAGFGIFLLGKYIYEKYIKLVFTFKFNMI